MNFRNLIVESKDVTFSFLKSLMNKDKASAGIWIRNSKAIYITIDADSKLATLNPSEQQKLADDIAKKVNDLVISELEKLNKN